MSEHPEFTDGAEFDGTGTLTDVAPPGTPSWQLTVGYHLVYHEARNQDGAADRLQRVAAIALQNLSDGEAQQLRDWLRARHGQDLYLQVPGLRTTLICRDDPTDPLRLRAIGAIRGERSAMEPER